jgi:hypothetical protein
MAIIPVTRVVGIRRTVVQELKGSPAKMFTDPIPTTKLGLMDHLISWTLRRHEWENCSPSQYKQKLENSFKK